MGFAIPISAFAILISGIARLTKPIIWADRTSCGDMYSPVIELRPPP